jgi:hypothetical protein
VEEKNNPLRMLQVCPYLGRAGDRHTYSAFPSLANRCWKCTPRGAISHAVQQGLCLHSTHLKCPVFTTQWHGPLPENMQARRIRRRRKERGKRMPLLAKIALPMLALVGLGMSFAVLTAQGRFQAPNSTAHAAVTHTQSPPTQTEVIPPTNTQASPFPTPTPSPAPTATATAAPGPELETPFGAFTMVIHRVLAGETWEDLAALYGTAVETMRAVNGRVSDLLSAGELIVIPIGFSSAVDLPMLVPWQVPAGGMNIEEVAELYEVDLLEICSLNELDRSAQLLEGYWLIIPLPPATPTPPLE